MVFLASIRSKIVVAVLIQTCLIGLVLFAIGKDLYANYKKLQIAQCHVMVKEETSKLAGTLSSLQANVLELALVGELLISEDPSSRDRQAEYAVVQNFNAQKDALGGGIWYIPYLFGGKRELTCYYAYKKDNATIFDPDFSKKAYYYPDQNWYRDAMRTFANGMGKDRRTVTWSPAYIDAAGACSLMTTASAPIITPTGEIAGLATIDWSLDDLTEEISSIRLTAQSATVFADVAHNVILSASGRHQDECRLAGSLDSLPWFDANAPEVRTLHINGTAYLSFARKFDNGMMVVVNVPENELFHDLNRGLLATLLTLICAMLAASLLIWSMLNRSINRPVTRLCRAVEEIGTGNLDARLPAGQRDELGSLARAFAGMTANLKKHIEHIKAITAEKGRIDAELNIARDIQAAMLPSVFPHRDECALSAVMRPAREVGGDFYDFFFLDDRRLAVVMADVSDKGVPAALFMAIAKALVRNCIQSCGNPGAALTMANSRLCENNAACMFVTAFAGIMDPGTGSFEYANAGHNPFFLCEPGRGVRPVQVKPALPLAAMPDSSYETCGLTLLPGSGIFLHTDGVTEAADPDGDFFGSRRLEDALDAHMGLFSRNLSEFIAGIMTRLEAFTRKAPQNDDITMLALAWKPQYPPAQGENTAKYGAGAEPPFHCERIFPAQTDALPDFMALMEKALAEGSFTDRQKMRFCVAAEEIFVNIAQYAYKDQQGAAEVEVSIEVCAIPSVVRLRLTDSGAAFNPLDREPPDPGLLAEDRTPGGLGIFLAARGSSSIRYAREEDKNILTLVLAANDDVPR